VSDVILLSAPGLEWPPGAVVAAVVVVIVFPPVRRLWEGRIDDEPEGMAGIAGEEGLNVGGGDLVRVAGDVKAGSALRRE
jgi:hypothetical protein